MSNTPAEIICNLVSEHLNRTDITPEEMSHIGIALGHLKEAAMYRSDALRIIENFSKENTQEKCNKAFEDYDKKMQHCRICLAKAESYAVPGFVSR